MKGNPTEEAMIPGRLAHWGALCRHPLTWTAVTAVLGISTRPEDRRAAIRGIACYLVAAGIANTAKLVFGRPQPRHRKLRKPTVVRGSFPSGHAAAQVAYVFGATQESPALLLPLATMATLGHLYLIKAGKHYLSDIFVGSIIGMGVSLITARRRPAKSTTQAQSLES